MTRDQSSRPEGQSVEGPGGESTAGEATGGSQHHKPAAEAMAEGIRPPYRRHLGLKGELLLALLPSATVMVAFAIIEALSNQRLLFASLASSALWIYADPRHDTNAIRTLTTAQLLAAGLGFLTYKLMGPSFPAGAVAMAATIFAMILLKTVHPPAASTAVSFALESSHESNLGVFALAVGVTAALVGLEWVVLRLLERLEQEQEKSSR